MVDSELKVVVDSELKFVVDSEHKYVVDEGNYGKKSSSEKTKFPTSCQKGPSLLENLMDFLFFFKEATSVHFQISYKLSRYRTWKLTQ